MTAKEKIEGSKYNLKKLKEPSGLDEFQFELNNFLGFAQSIRDHLLVDFAGKYRLKLKMYNEKEFGIKANLSGFRKAMDFIEWFSSQMEQIRNNSDYGFLIKKKHMDVYEKTVKEGDLVFTSTSPVQTPWKSITESGREVYRCFYDKDKEVVSTCDQFLKRLIKLRNDAKENF